MNSTVKRSIFGVVFLAVMLGGLLFHELAFLSLFLFISGQLVREFCQVNLQERSPFLQKAGVATAMLLFVLGYFYFRGAASLSLYAGLGLLSVTLLLCLSVLQPHHEDFRDFAFVLAALLYIGLPMSLSNAVVFGEDGAFSGLLMLSFFCIIWASDVGAYCFGMAIGQKLWPAKLCPAISPKKSWAGFIGGLLTAVLAGAVIHWTGLVSIPLVHCLAMAALMHVFGVFGDLFESLWKRAAGVKDSGNLIPGHGGLWDRFDSALFAIPAAYVYLLIFSLI